MVRFVDILLILLALPLSVTARPITLHEVIDLARTQSVDAAVAMDELRTAYWEYRTYRAELLPEINFSAKIPGYYKQYSPYQLDDGSYTFVRNNYMQMNGEISVSQNIWLTGGTLSLTTSADFVRQLDGNRRSRFMSVPVALTLEQPLFGINTVRWLRRMEPVRYREAQSRFLSATETVAMTAIQHFFSLLMARENVSVARQNLANADKLYEVAIAKRAMGKISRNDLLQLELNRLNAQSTLTDAESTFKSNMFGLRSFLGIDEDVELEPELPGRVPECEVEYADALDKALSNNQFSYNIRRRQIEADYEVAKAKGNLRQINVYASVGFTGTDSRMDNAYRNLKDNQVVEVGVRIPLVDWGKRRGQVKVARSNRQVVESKLRQEAMNFHHNLFILVERFNNQQRQVAIAAKADTIAGTRYETNVQTFMIGRISTLDLNDSQVRKDEQRQQYINELYMYWYYYYQLRSLTLWDYAENRNIDADFEKIARQ